MSVNTLRDFLKTFPRCTRGHVRPLEDILQETADRFYADMQLLREEELFDMLSGFVMFFRDTMHCGECWVIENGQATEKASQTCPSCLDKS